VGPSPTFDSLVEEGWIAYRAGDFEIAVAKFDSALLFNVEVPEAYLGLGWSQAQVGQFTDALNNLSLAITLEGNRPVIEVFEEKINGDSTWMIHFLVAPLKTPLLGVPELEIECIVSDTTPVRNIPGKTVLYDVIFLTDSTLDLAWSNENDSTVIIPPDTIAIPVVPSPPEAGDTLILNYTYYMGGETDLQEDAYAGISTLSSANNEELLAVINGNGVLHMDSAYFFSKDSTGANARKTHLLLAQSYYNLKLFDNSSVEVIVVDPSWAIDPKNDPNSPTYLYDLLKKIEDLRGGG